MLYNDPLDYDNGRYLFLLYFSFEIIMIKTGFKIPLTTTFLLRNT